MRLAKMVSVLVLLTSVTSQAESKKICEIVETKVHQYLVNSPENVEELNLSFKRERENFAQINLESAYCQGLLNNLEAKEQSQAHGLQINAEKLLKQSIQYETFRLQTFISAGVSPKRYFGFLDEQADTQAFERTLRRTIIDAVKITNEYAAGNRLNLELSEKEVTLTFLSEGGALMLSRTRSDPNRVHIDDIGLDDLKRGMAKHPELVSRFDYHFGTRLEDIQLRGVNRFILLRPMTFRESILGTTLMYLFEKELTASKMRREWEEELTTLPIDQQFVCTSLVYNCGILFSRERVQQILRFETADYLAMVNLRSGRPKLPVMSSMLMRRYLADGKPIPRQLTSWSAVYHILQRYGTWVALERYSSIFKGGQFALRD